MVTYQNGYQSQYYTQYRIIIDTDASWRNAVTAQISQTHFNTPPLPKFHFHFTPFFFPYSWFFLACFYNLYILTLLFHTLLPAFTYKLFYTSFQLQTHLKHSAFHCLANSERLAWRIFYKHFEFYRLISNRMNLLLDQMRKSRP